MTEEKKIEEEFKTLVVNPTDGFAAVDRYEKEIKSLIGAADFKRFALNFCELVRCYLQTANPVVKDAIVKRNYIYRISDGCGFTYSGFIIADLLRKTVFPDTAFCEMTMKREKGDFVLSKPLYLFGNEDSEYKVECIDISEVASMTDMPGFRKIMKMFFGIRETRIVLFRLKNASNRLFDKVYANIGDIMFVEKFDFQPLTDRQEFEYVERCLERVNVALPKNQNAYSDVIGACDIEKKDGKFYGFKTLEKVADKMVISSVEYDISIKGQKEKYGTGEKTVLNSVCVSPDLSVGFYINGKSAEERLNELVGLEKVKKEIAEIVNQIAYYSSQSVDKMPCVHMQFVGPPGTGKTTVARIVGQMLAEKEVLAKGAFFEYSARQLCGRYIGDTEYITSEICREAYGSVLFIDEAYALCKSETDDRDFGKEAVNTLITEMENNRSELLVILAGYEKDMQRLMNMNSGLESRVPYRIVFPSYTRKELFEMFMGMVKSEFDFTDELKESAETYFSSLPDDYVKSDNFGNGRFVRNLYERVRGKAISKITDKYRKIVVGKEDFEDAAGDGEFNFSSYEKNTAKIGFGV